MAARLGGDEFAVMLYNTTEAENIVMRIQDKIESHNDIPEALPIFMSIGVASSEHSISLYKLLSRADEAMLQNKKTTKENLNANSSSLALKKSLGERLLF